MATAVSRAMVGRRSGLVAFFALGALVALGQAPLGWAWLAMVAMCAAIALFSQIEDGRIAWWRGWALGTGHFAIALSWIVEPFLVDLARHGWMAPFALVFMAGGLALFWATAFALATWLGRGPGERVLWLIVLLGTAEMLRSYILTGFPWALIGHIWIGLPQMQGAAIFGAHGLTLMTLLAAAMPVLFGSRRALLGCLVSVSLLSLPAVYARLRVPEESAAGPDRPVIIRLVQPNAPQHEKWDPALIPVFLDRKLRYTAAATSEGARPDVVVWPETSVPYLLRHADPVLRRIAEAADGAEVVIGVQRRDDAGRWFNSLAVLDASGAVRDTYDKHHLVPFGEYMPLMDVFSRWGVFGLAANATGGYSAGPGPRLVDLGRAGRAVPLICYEAIFPQDIAALDDRGGWIVHITNDAWFGRISGPYQHLALARLRAVEQGLPVARAANTGISALFDPYGREIVRVDLGEAGYADAHLPAPIAAPLYARSGDGPIAGGMALVTLVLIARRRRKAAG
ncbi:apolipoprotein N-acyltransferase [Aliiruegeria haliotis]|uniref:Apolipoprotein N-acyltransferase n=1 Tax=Aliiruegeria haliotis TaxID=1280846 RepID=A0A2T0RW93_9RHOB|nr:apolipoprotein N-acyltransferase [Aliiruegeria haliotis]PRY25417.1 apolipoprotein N-acyltransferase [Aliiruegeria haliotis]